MSSQRSFPQRLFSLLLMGVLLSVGFLPAGPVQPGNVSAQTRNGQQQRAPEQRDPKTPPPPPGQAVTAQAGGRANLTNQVTDPPRPQVTTSGAVGTAASFTLPARLADAGLVATPSQSDWTAAFTETFESGLGSNWTAFDDNEDGIERTWGIDDYYAHSGTQSLWVSAGGAEGLDPEMYYYPHNLDSWLMTNGYFDLSTVQMADVEFYMNVDTEPEYDWIFVGASVDGQTFYGEYWTGNSGGWQYYNLDLSEYAGYSQVYLAWYFHSDEDNFNNIDYNGVWLDDITVWTYTETSPPEGSEEVQNGDFETGDLSGWTVPDGSTVTVTEAENPVDGSYVAYFGGIPDANEQFYQPITVPTGDPTSVHFGFWVNQFGNETTVDSDLFCMGLYNADRTAILVDLGCLDGTEVLSAQFDPDDWWQVDYELSGEEWDAIAGQTINIVFEMYTDDTLNTTVFIDDVTFEVVTGGSAGDALEPNDSFDDATPATPGTPMTALTIDPDKDYDFFSLAGNAGDTVTVDIDAAVNGSALDGYVWLLDAAGTVICENDDDPYSFDPFMACTLPASGTYYVVVSSYDGRGSRSYVYNLLIALNGSTTPTEPDPTPPPPTGDTKAWTAIIYIAGDNNLCDAYPELITRMGTELAAKIGPDGFLNVAVLFDRDPSYCNGQGGTTRYLIQPGNEYQDSVNRWDMGELNTGDPQTLINFATWAMQNYPAEHYYLAIDDHGDGVTGIGWDDTNDHDYITNAELYAALKQITNNGSRKIDIFAYEACLMGMYENAYDIRDLVDYIFFFQTISWTNNASYPAYLGNAGFTATTTGEAFGNIIFDEYYAAVRNPYAVSLVDASKIDALRVAVNAWADALNAQLPSARDTIATARQQAQTVEVDGDDEVTASDYYLDLWDLADQMAAQGVATAESAALKSAIEAAVLRANFRSNRTWNYDNTHGVSIYWPLTARGAYANYVNDRLYTSTRDGTWDEFLKAYLGDEGRRGLPVSPGPVERLPATTVVYPVYLPVITK